MDQLPPNPSQQPHRPLTPPPPYTATPYPRPSGVLSSAALTATILTKILHNNLIPPTRPKPHSTASIQHLRSLLLEDNFFFPANPALETRSRSIPPIAAPTTASVKFADLVVVLGRLLRVFFWRQHGFPDAGAGVLYDNARREALELKNACFALPFFQRGRAEREIWDAGN